MRTPGILFLMFSSVLATAQSYHTIASGAWSDTNVWDCACVPTGGDSVLIDHAVSFASDLALDTTNFSLGQSGSLSGLASLRCRSLINNGTVNTGRTELLGTMLQYPLINNGSVIGADILMMGSFFNTGVLRAADSLVWLGQSLNAADAKLVCSVLSGDHHQNFGVDSIGSVADLSVGSNGGFSAFVVSGDAANLTFSGVNAHFLGNASFAQFSVGYNCRVDGDMIITGPSNFVSGQVQVGGSLFVEDLVNLVDSTTLFWAEDLVNNGSIFGEGSFCITDTVINNGGIYGSIDICDLSPTTTIPPFIDGGQGPIASTVTYCMGGYCAVGIVEQRVQPVLLIYPNPTSGNVMLIGAPVGSRYHMIDLHGRKLIEGTITSARQPIHAVDLLPGMYLLHVRSAEQSATVRLFRQ